MIKQAGLVLKYMYPQATFEDIQVVEDGDGTRIAKFNSAKLGAQPTEAAIAAKETEAVSFYQALQAQRDSDQIEVVRLKALPRKDWTANDLKLATQILIARL